MVELFRYSPNNLQQVWAYVGADRGEGIPALAGARFVVGLLAPFPGGMSSTAPASGLAGAHLIRDPRSTVAVVVGLAVILILLSLSLAPRLARLGDVSRQSHSSWPSRHIVWLARAAVLGVATTLLTVNRLPLSSTESTWNYLQVWPVSYFAWGVVVAWAVESARAMLSDHRKRVAQVSVAAGLLAGLIAAFASPTPSRWHEGDGAVEAAAVLAEQLAAASKEPPGDPVHVSFDGDTLAAGYFLAPGLASSLKGHHPVHLPAVWSSPEDTDFRKTVSSPPDSAWVSIREGDLQAGVEGVNPASRPVTTAADSRGDTYTIFLRVPRRL